jgi:hypothetical protein
VPRACFAARSVITRRSRRTPWPSTQHLQSWPAGRTCGDCTEITAGLEHSLGSSSPPSPPSASLPTADKRGPGINQNQTQARGSQGRLGLEEKALTGCRVGARWAQLGNTAFWPAGTGHNTLTLSSSTEEDTRTHCDLLGWQWNQRHLWSGQVRVKEPSESKRTKPLDSDRDRLHRGSVPIRCREDDQQGRKPEGGRRQRVSKSPGEDGS